MLRPSHSLTTAAVMLGLASASALAQNQPTVPRQDNQLSQPSNVSRSNADSDDISAQLRRFAQDPKTAPEKLFVLHAGMGNQFEIQLAQAVEKKAQNAQVKAVASQIAADHQKANEQLQRVAQQLDVQLPTVLPDEKQQEIRILTSLPADQLEKHYISMMQADHAKDLITYRSCAQMSQNQQVKDYAQQTLPALASHMSHVDQAAMALGIPTSTAGEAVPAAGRIQGSDLNTGSGARNEAGRGMDNRPDNTGVGR